MAKEKKKMINVPGLICNDEKAYDICVKHINESILVGVELYKETCDYDFDFEQRFEIDEHYAHIFPEGFNDGRYDAVVKVIEKVKSPQVVELNPTERYILLRCLEDAYLSQPTEYTLESASRQIANRLILMCDNIPDGLKSLLGSEMVSESELEDADEHALNIQPISNLRDRFYVMSRMACDAARICEEEQEDGDNVTSVLEFLMSQVEDVTKYDDLCFCLIG
jgi:hypothetical protein